MDLILIQIVKELLELYDSITTEELAERIGISLSSVRHRNCLESMASQS